MFTIVGALLAIYGLVSDKQIYERSLGININLWWGLFLVLFGVVMLFFGLRSRADKTPPPPAPDNKPRH
jgi:hypothetical protein